MTDAAPAAASPSLDVLSYRLSQVEYGMGAMKAEIVQGFREIRDDMARANSQMQGAVDKLNFVPKDLYASERESSNQRFGRVEERLNWLTAAFVGLLVAVLSITLGIVLAT